MLIKVKGGLGNQLFQYAFAMLMKRITGKEVKLDMMSFDGVLDDPIRRPRLLKFKTSIPMASAEDINALCCFKHTGNMMSLRYRVSVFFESLFNRGYYREVNRAYIDPHSICEYSYYDGYWQSWRYPNEIWDELRLDLTPSYDIHPETKKMISLVGQTNSVFLGVRRGDYTQEIKHYGSFGNNYYRSAMKYIYERVKDPVFYVFSNDISWVKENIDFSSFNVIFREKEEIVDDFEDLLIMSSCKHSIIINSTYHWWGARLNDNPNKIVIAPRKWFFDNKPIDIIPPHWIRMDDNLESDVYR